MTYNDYYLTRQIVESILHHVDPKSYKEILILDDYSDPKGRLRQYEEYLKTVDKIRVINFDEHRRMSYYMDGVAHQFENEKSNLGHGRGMNLGIKESTTEFIFYLDIDCIFLSKSKNMLFEMAEHFDKNPKVLGMGQLFGIDGERGKIVDKYFEFFMPQKHRNALAGGFVGPSAGAFRVSTWRNNLISPFRECKLGYLFNWVSRDILDHGYQTLSYPYFTDLQILHLGKGVVRTQVGKMNGNPNDWFVFCKEFHTIHGSRYGEKNLGGHHYGRGFVNMTSEEYYRYLEQKFGIPFDQRQPPLDEDLIYTID
jgi:glycosyltransferase involved in cell wall biosynthesis